MAAAPQHYVRMPPKLPDELKSWICVYPIYINKDRTLAEGRRVKKTLAVKNPLFQELLEVLSTTGLKFFGEPNKVHPREKCKEPQFYGRVRVELFDEEGKVVSERFKCRDDVYVYLAKMIPQLKSRNQPKVNPDEKKKGKGKKK